MAKEKIKRKKGAKKKFFESIIPLTSTKVHLYGYSLEELENKIVKLDLTKNLRGKNLELRTKLKLENGKLNGELLTMKLIPSYIKKIMRRGTSYIEDSFKIDCRDAKLIIKPLMITRKRVSRAVRKTIRNNAKKHLEGKIKIRNTKELFSEIMSGKLQKELSQKIKKIYPLALCEIRHIEVIEKIENKKEKPEKSEQVTESEKSPKQETKKEQE